MIKIIDIEHIDEWNNLVKSFPNWDIYYMNEYATSLMLHGDGTPYLLYWEYESKKICYVLMVEDIAQSRLFANNLKLNTYFDATVPYGYGGPLVNKKLSSADIRLFAQELKELLTERNIVSQFLRFHPLMGFQEDFHSIFEAVSFKDTVFIDTMNLDSIWSNMDSSNRNMIRKAIKLGITIEHDKGENIDSFIDIYNSTMDGHDADEYYYFDSNYYTFLTEKMSNNMEIFYSYLGDKIIGASIVFYNGKYMHYHLSGSYREYRQYASTNLLLYEAAKWANQLGIEKFHLGGGLTKDDSLFKFKKKFNKQGIVPFYVGRMICDKDKYNELLEMRAKADNSFDKNNNFLIQYRK